MPSAVETGNNVLPKKRRQNGCESNQEENLSLAVLLDYSRLFSSLQFKHAASNSTVFISDRMWSRLLFYKRKKLPFLICLTHSVQPGSLWPCGIISQKHQPARCLFLAPKKWHMLHRMGPPLIKSSLVLTGQIPDQEPERQILPSDQTDHHICQLWKGIHHLVIFKKEGMRLNFCVGLWDWDECACLWATMMQRE